MKTPVTPDEVRTALAAALRAIAPDADIAGVAEAADYRAELGLDSFDFLRLMQQLYEATGVDIPEDAYASVSSIKGLHAYVLASTVSAPATPNR
jgi:acyl carrier protein